MSRMRVGEWVAAVGAVALFALMFFDWFTLSLLYVPESTTPQELARMSAYSGWSGLGWFVGTLAAILIFGGLVLSYMTVKRASPAWPVGAAVLTWVFGSLIFLVIVVRVAIVQPGLPMADDRFTDVELPAYLGLVAAFLIPLGGFLSIRDERTASAEARAYVPPPPRSVPGT